MSRSRNFSPRAILRKFARWAWPGERLIMLVFIFGLSTRKVAQALLPILGEKVSPTTVSRIVKSLN
ncbi:MAG: transposase [Thermodesulfobacteriota bacterium]